MNYNKIKTVYKPWGKEEWLELNDMYCYKRIYIDSGHRTSYQYHETKIETNYIIDGEAEVWLENDDGVVEKKLMKAGDFFTVYPPKKHRVVALTDIILQEASTIEVDDVIRIEDDNQRGAGRLNYEHKNPVLCIVAAGKGSRIKHFSKHINKGLLPINNKAIISDVIDKTPNECDIVIAVGYKSSLIKEYCNAAHSDRNIIYVDVDKVDGKGSGPGYSLLCCKKYLQRPFYLAVADCLIKDDLPPLSGNWLGVYPTSMPEIYSTVDIDENMNIIDFKNKDKHGFEHAFIGVCGIFDFKIFWYELKKNIGDTGELVSAFYNINMYKSAVATPMEWYDIGTTDNYIKAKLQFDNEKYGIPKDNGEFLYKVDNKFIKIFSDNKLVTEKIKRAEILKTVVPNLIYKGNNVFSYEWIEGDTLYNVRDENVWCDFLIWCDNNLWKPNTVDIKDQCIKFYKEKTLSRLKLFLDKKDENYKEAYIINGKKCGSIFEYINKIDWNYICNGISTQLFHGDLQFDNVIYDGNSFKLIDWRDTFGESALNGDVYYDLSKLYGGLSISYKLVKEKANYSFYKSFNDVTFSYSHDKLLDSFKEYFEKWVISHNYDLRKIKELTALIYLNMSPLHTDKLDNLLFFKSISLMEELYGST